MTGADATLARVRQLLPADWDEREARPAANRRALVEIRAVLYPRAKVRARIVAYVQAAGVVRMTEIRDALGLRGGQLSGHLTALVAQQRLTRAARGVYCMPGTDPDVAIVLAGRPLPARRAALAAALSWGPDLGHREAASMITILIEYAHEQTAVGRAMAASQPDGPFPGCQVQVIVTRPGEVPAHGAADGPLPRRSPAA